MFGDRRIVIIIIIIIIIVIIILSWQRGVVVNALVAINESYSTLGPVSAGMSEYLRSGKPSLYVTNHLGQLSLPSLRGR